mmetsp:Transcript_15222/g.21343  ORF Transcript_15222/g.21343 Transcript_15222/m.21343 type:complete len:128 (+) Transcript_15222:107-490(+)
MCASRVANNNQPDVTWQDQQKICLFGRLNTRQQELKELILQKQDDISKLEDASDEIFIADEVKCVIGECFYPTEVDHVEKLISTRKSEQAVSLQKMQGELRNIEERMRRLKSELKIRFGDSIYLEND